MNRQQMLVKSHVMIPRVHWMKQMNFTRMELLLFQTWDCWKCKVMRWSFKMSGAGKKQKCSEIRYVEKFMTAL